MRLTVAILDKDLPIITGEKWGFLKQLCEILEPLEKVKRLVSGENYSTASVILTDGLENVYQNLQRKIIQATTSPPVLFEVIDKIVEGIKVRLDKRKQSDSLTTSTLLDPRFKNVGFANDITTIKSKKTINFISYASYYSQNEDFK